MIIEYRDTARCKELHGIDFKAFLYYRKRNSHIVYELWETVEQNISTIFDHLYPIIKESYKNKKSKSSIEIYRPNKDTIEMTNKGIFPNIMIVRL